ncbi:MAG: PBP1A family penicillin-binding protein [Patescibacteria group bacterium]
MLGRILIYLGKPFYLGVLAILELALRLERSKKQTSKAVPKPTKVKIKAKNKKIKRFSRQLISFKNNLKKQFVRKRQAWIKTQKTFKQKLLASKQKIKRVFSVKWPSKKVKTKKKPAVVKKKVPRQIIINQKGFLVFLFGLGVVILIASGLINFFADFPSPSHLVQMEPTLTTKIYDRNHVLLYKIYRDENRTLVPLEKIPEHLIQATLAIEDKEFYQHHGLSILGILRALKHNLLSPSKPAMGGSTITQQLVKNTLLSPEKTVERKIKEAILAVLVEIRFSKDEILQMYFNEVPYGGTNYGVEEAAENYFGKHVWELDRAESALLAGLTKAPTKYSPFGAYPEYAKQRQEQVIQEMVKAKYITAPQAGELVSWPLHFASQGNSIKAPHFVFFVKDILVENYGQQMVEQGGLEVITTLDWEIQQMAEQILEQEIDKLKNMRISNGSVLITNPKTGEILAMVGSKDYFDFENDGNVNLTLRLRQPGSTIKPVNYANALSMGFTAASIIPDTPITFKIPGQAAYSPRNYDGKFHGNVSLRTALASSLNVPAVKVLSSYGVDDMVSMGQKLGIKSWDDPTRFGLSLTLGGGEVKMIELAQAYSVLANYGKKVSINPIVSVTDYQDKKLFQNHCLDGNFCYGIQTLDPGISFILTDIISDNNARAMAFGTNSLLNLPGVAVKTGTTNNLKDNWCIGYSPEILTAVWVGNNDNTPMSGVASGITGATPIWRQVMNQLLKDQPAPEWAMPDNVKKVAICQSTGTLTCNNCPSVKEEYFIDGTQPTQHCRLDITPTPTP